MTLGRDYLNMAFHRTRDRVYRVQNFKLTISSNHPLILAILLTSVSGFATRSVFYYLKMCFNLDYGWEKVLLTHSITVSRLLVGSGSVVKWQWWRHSVPGLSCLNMIWDVERRSRLHPAPRKSGIYGVESIICIVGLSTRDARGRHLLTIS